MRPPSTICVSKLSPAPSDRPLTEAEENLGSSATVDKLPEINSHQINSCQINSCQINSQITGDRGGSRVLDKPEFSQGSWSSAWNFPGSKTCSASGRPPKGCVVENQPLLVASGPASSDL